MVRPNTRAAAVSLIAAVGIPGLVNAFVSSPPNFGPTGLSALRRGSVLSTTTGTTRSHTRSTPQLSVYGKGRGDREATASGRGDEGASTGAGVEERTPSAKLRPAVATSSTVSGLAVGAAVVALSTLGGFPDLAAAEAPAWVLPTKLVLDPVLLYFEVAFVARIILSWYPKLDLNSAPQNLVAWPTEPILKPTRAVIPPAFGVDISPIVWVMICSLLHEILLGQQGILNLMSNK